jgi:ribulose-5-phosphate 4-epimerase/fuculose-1-phosphate aldolase
VATGSEAIVAACAALRGDGYRFAVEKLACRHHAVLLANHGPVVAGTSLADAVYAIEELEQTAKLLLLLKDARIRCLSDAQCTALKPGVGS